MSKETKRNETDSVALQSKIFSKERHVFDALSVLCVDVDNNDFYKMIFAIS